MPAYLPRLAFPLALLLQACSPADPIQRFSGPAQGSSYNISYWTEQDVDAKALQHQIVTELERIDLAMSNYRPDSAIEQFNAATNTGLQPVGTELTQMVEDARTVNKASQGCYDLTVKPLFDLWGFKADQFNRPTPEQQAATLAITGMDKIVTTSDGQMSKALPQMRIDLSSIAQGYTVRQLAEVLEKAGITNYLVEVGGELQVRGKKPGEQPWKVAIEKPLPGEQRLQKVIVVKQDEPLAIISSGTYRHYFDDNGQRYSHVLDARAGAPVRHQTVATTVLIDNATLGDAWSTAFLCLGSQEGMAVADQLGMAVLFIDQNGEELTEKYSKALRDTQTVELQ